MGRRPLDQDHNVRRLIFRTLQVSAAVSNASSRGNAPIPEVFFRFSGRCWRLRISAQTNYPQTCAVQKKKAEEKSAVFPQQAANAGT
jgi:hypothetical protein